MHQCVFGGQYGSEGKGAVSEHYAQFHPTSDMLIVAGENSPNSGHTCSAGKTRNIPAASFWADAIMLGPDSVIDFDILIQDLTAVANYQGMSPNCIIHENAVVLTQTDKDMEHRLSMDISSTGSGSGHARVRKCFERKPENTIGYWRGDHLSLWNGQAKPLHVEVFNRMQWMNTVQAMTGKDWLFECSQGMLLDVSWGIYPWVTSRSTSPRVTIERSGFGQLPWQYTGVYRTYPIRTGGPSGPTGGEETSFKSIGVEDEIATVTKRKRRVFEFASDDFWLSNTLARPNKLAFTHVDYLMEGHRTLSGFKHWLDEVNVLNYLTPHQTIMYSTKHGQFQNLPL